MSPRVRRLYAEYERIKVLFEDHPRIRIVEAIGDPPTRYIVEYSVKGLIETREGLKEHDKHRVQITLGENYPNEMPVCVVLDTPVFHPNIDAIAICTEDVSVAGRRLEETIVFIGREITYQDYNLKSPRNGDAARWTEQNRSRLPLETVELMPRAILEGAVIPVPSISEVKVQSAARFSTIACGNCGQNAAGTCSNGHSACADCSLECAYCGERLCVSCKLLTCGECKKTVCAGCGTKCSSCASIVCPDHRIECATCKSIQCGRCLSECAGCGSAVCGRHLSPTRLCVACEERAKPAEQPVAISEPTLFLGLSSPRQGVAGLDSGREQPLRMAQSASALGSHSVNISAVRSDPLQHRVASQVEKGKGNGVKDEERPHLSSAIVITPEEAFRVPEEALIPPKPEIEIKPAGSTPVAGKAVASLIFGILGLPVLGLLVGWFAIGLGAMALRQIREQRQMRGRGMAVAGIVLGIIDIIGWIILAIAYSSTLFATRFGR